MTRRNDRGAKSGDEPKSAFVALRAFFSGYLHQDFRDEYESAGAAASAFCREAAPDQLATVLREWSQWRKLLASASSEEIAVAIRRLGGAWQPASSADLDQIEQRLAGRR